MRTTTPMAPPGFPETAPPDTEKPRPSRARRNVVVAAEETDVAVAGAQWNIEGRARSLRLEPGTHALVVGPSAASAERVAGIVLPVTHIAPRASGGGEAAVVSTSGGENGWLGPRGGTVVVKVSGQAAPILVTTLGVTDGAALPTLKMLDLDGLAAAELPAQLPAEAPAPEGRELAGELMLHIERQGDRRFAAAGWAGNPGERLRIEGFAIRPLEAIAPSQIEYMAFGPAGRQTPWVTDVRMCGTRGRGLPLTGFAIRLAPPLRERFDIVYEGYFFDSGVRGPSRNGEPCLPSVADDPLSAIRLRVVERPGA